VVDLKINLRSGQPSDSELGFPGFWKVREVNLNPAENDRALLHTLGRALGFENEYGIAEAGPRECRACGATAGDCDDEELCLDSGYCGQPYLHQSVMSAPDCGGTEATRPFSSWDAWGAQRAYGLKPKGALVDTSGHCAHVPAQPGGVPFTASCGDSQAMRFSLVGSGSSRALEARVNGDDLCLSNVLGSGAGSETAPLTVDRCDGTASQAVSLEGVSLMSVGTSCVGVTSPSAGGQMLLSACEAQNTRWDVLDGQLRLSGTQLCASVPHGAATLGAVIELRPCSTAAREQHFVFNERGILFTDTSGATLCLNLFGGLPMLGLNVGLWNGCGFFDNGFFYVSGPVNVGGRCLTQSATGQLATAPCSTSKKQTWDFYW
jgi:hypothetical protein